MATDEIRPDSRAGLIMKEMLDRCEFPRLPSLDGDARVGNAVPPTRPLNFRDGLRPGMGAAEAEWLVYTAECYWKIDARDHDAAELRRYLALVGKAEGWMAQTIYPDAVMLYSPWEARGRWMDATGGRHDFGPSCPRGWTLADGTLAGEGRSALAE